MLFAEGTLSSSRAILLLFVLIVLAATPSLSDEHQRSRRHLHANVQTSTRRPQGLGPDDPWIEHLSWKPRAWLYHNFMTAEEVEHIVDLARPSMARSTVVDAETGNSVLDPIRTSQGTFLSRYQDEVVRDIEDRVAHWTHLPADHGEDLQVLKYEPGQKYLEHWDWFEEEERKKMDLDDTNRIATILIYLTDVEEGGETAFSKSEWLNETAQRQAAPSECAAAKVFVKPRRGDALLFWDLKPDGQTGDKWSMHAGCPVIRGEKWSATKWLHNGVYGDPCEMQRLAAERANFVCRDTGKDCAHRVKQGQCRTLQRTMVGTLQKGGECMLSCGACTPCAQGDLICQRRSERMRKAAVKVQQ